MRLVTHARALVPLWLAFALCQPTVAQASEWMLSLGGGPQLHTDKQTNRAVALDAHLFSHDYSALQTWHVGVSAARLQASTPDADNNALWAISLYPQLNLPLPWADAHNAFFYVRTLAPTWISEKQLGERKQAYHFVFQSQVGVGFRFGEQNQWSANLGYRHYSNAGLGEPNEGMDATLLLTLGRRL